MKERLIPKLIVLTACSFLGCIQVPAEPAPPPTTISSFGPMGSFTMTSGANCSGHATLIDGAATINDACFTAVDNVVLCTDTTSAAAVRCAPAAGSLAISGANGDSIAYARLR